MFFFRNNNRWIVDSYGKKNVRIKSMKSWNKKWIEKIFIFIYYLNDFATPCKSSRLQTIMHAYVLLKTREQSSALQLSEMQYRNYNYNS